MDALDANINVQTLIGLFMLVFSLLVVLLGFLLMRFQFLDGKSFYFSHTLGKIFLITGGILALTSMLILLYIRVAY